MTIDCSLNICFSFSCSFWLFHHPPVTLSHALSPSLQGRCVITVQLADEELDAAAKEEEGVDFFLLFAGSTQRHLTSTFRSSHDTLQALCPGEPHRPTRPRRRPSSPRTELSVWCVLSLSSVWTQSVTPCCRYTFRLCWFITTNLLYWSHVLNAQMKMKGCSSTPTFSQKGMVLFSHHTQKAKGVRSNYSCGR